MTCSEARPDWPNGTRPRAGGQARPDRRIGTRPDRYLFGHGWRRGTVALWHRAFEFAGDMLFSQPPNRHRRTSSMLPMNGMSRTNAVIPICLSLSTTVVSSLRVVAAEATVATFSTPGGVRGGLRRALLHPAAFSMAALCPFLAFVDCSFGSQGASRLFGGLACF